MSPLQIMDLPKTNCRTEDKMTCNVTEVKSPLHQLQTVTAHCKFENFHENFNFPNSITILVNVYVDLVVFTHIAGTS